MARVWQLGVLALCCLGLVLTVVPEAWGHKRPRSREPLQPAAGAVSRVSPKAAKAHPSDQENQAEARALWLQAQAQEKVGNLQDCANILMKFINLFPYHPDRGQALLKCAHLAQMTGHLDKALKVYTLTANLYPGTQMATQALWQASAVELRAGLAAGDPVPALRRFLEGLEASPGRFPEGLLQEALQAGWRALAEKVRNNPSDLLPMLEEVLALWDLHPPGTQPPEAKLLLAQLLKETGFVNQAGDLLQKLCERGPSSLRPQVFSDLLELAWVSQGWPEVVNALKLWRQTQGNASGGLRQGAAGDGDPHGSGVGEELPACTQALGMPWTVLKTLASDETEGHLQELEEMLHRPLAAGLREKVMLKLAQLYRQQGDFARAAEIYRGMATQAPPGEAGIFYYDRLGTCYVKGRNLDLAQEVFQGMEREADHFWQLLARVRLLDLELARLKAEPSP